jgi:hypothetical protein
LNAVGDVAHTPYLGERKVFSEGSGDGISSTGHSVKVPPLNWGPKVPFEKLTDD